MKLIISALLLTVLNALLITVDFFTSGYSEYDIPLSELKDIDPNRFLYTDQRKMANLAHASDRDIEIIEREDKLEAILAFRAELHPAPKDPLTIRQENLAYGTKLEPRKHYLLSSLD